MSPIQTVFMFSCLGVKGEYCLSRQRASYVHWYRNRSHNHSFKDVEYEPAFYFCFWDRAIKFLTSLFLSFRWQVEPCSNTKFQKLKSFSRFLLSFWAVKRANKTVLGLQSIFDRALMPLWNPGMMT